MVQLLVAHPGHELLLHAWIARNKPVVQVLTGGPAPRLERTAELLRGLGARSGAIFGRLSDREAYAMILERNTALLVALAEELAAELEHQRTAMIVVDAVEGYNPVHDLCRLVAGAAIAIAGTETKLYEYAVVDRPGGTDAAIVVDLDDAEFDAKMTRARAYAVALNDVDELLSRYGADAYRRETLRLVADWTAISSGAPPRYERYGEERVSAGRYAHVIRRDEHMLPLRDALRAEVEKRSCAF